MNKLLALADRVEKLTGPDREVDAEIFMALGMDKRYAGTFAAINYPVSYRIENGMTAEQAIAAGCPKSLIASHYRAPAYTASLDAAMTLVPEGWGYGLDYSPLGSGLCFILGSPDRKPVFIRGEAMTFPSAIVAAALRARAHGGGEG